jgi:palmitoyltransferase ZDHHC9/14/18
VRCTYLAGPWVGNCVGERNYRHFYLFITILSLLCIFTFACSILHLILCEWSTCADQRIQQFAVTTMMENTFLATMEKTPGSLIVSLICFFR